MREIASHPSGGEERSAWIVDYSVDGRRHIKTFRTKKEADSWWADVAGEVTASARIQEEGLSVRAVESLVQERIREEDGPVLAVVGSDGVRRKRTQNEHLASLEQDVRASLGTKVEIRQGSRGRGKIVIHFNSHEEFDRIRQLLCEGAASVGVSRVG